MSKRFRVMVGSSPWSEDVQLKDDYKMTVLLNKDKQEFCKATATKHLNDMKVRGYAGYLEEV